MYEVDRFDTLVALEGFPQMDPGAPLPHVVSDDSTLAVAFYLFDTPADWDGTTCKIVYAAVDTSPVAIVRFRSPSAHMFGSPNDEALAGHPLADRGLRAYRGYEVINSSWIRKLERMNSVHHFHDPSRFDELKHFIFVFHDNTFECVAPSYEIELTHGPLRTVVHKLVDEMQ